MCCLKILGGDAIKNAYKYRGEPAKVYIHLTDYEFTELSEFYDFHKRNMRKEFKQMKMDFHRAYQYKHQLYCSEKVEDDNVLTRDEYFKIFKYADEMQDVSFYKRLKE